jgi:hypothetical protein
LTHGLSLKVVIKPEVLIKSAENGAWRRVAVLENDAAIPASVSVAFSQG